ncbi:hypothetical protein LPU83_1534 [Rhizobium favelukesii]|uniref:Uncharacterized protein n=1 Tax=Rhizobium favelukesii TaxID=348824 RepID=W6RS95_9HYPH|nr:hypothetical protein [Rhizobium favelukesii]CDM57206.1 hypothetical protein LPU83_1534 [Rhizobium favelukesii]
MAAILPSSYKEGTVTIANGSTAVTGTNTFWGDPNGEGNPILPGDWFGVHKGYAIRIASIEGNGALTLANPWPGPSQTDAAYEVMLQSDNARMATSTRQLLQQLMNGNIAAFTGLSGEPDTVPYFVGPGAMGLLTRQDLTQGVNYDVQVDTLTDRAAYDLQVPGFAILVSDVGDGRAAIYSKVTAASGDWSDPAYITGPRGLNWKGAWSGATAYEKDDAVSYNNASWIALVENNNVAPVAGATWGLLAARGATGAIGVNPRGAYDNATAYAVTDSVLYNGSTWIAIAATIGNAPPNLPTTSNTWWQLLAQKGVDGTGTGDVVGPIGAVDGNVPVFDTATGKKLKDGFPVTAYMKTLLDDTDSGAARATLAGFGVVRQTVFTASGTFTPHADMIYCIIDCYGAGGGGGGAALTTSNTINGAGGGGAGAKSRKIASKADIGASQAVSIGAAGTAGSSAPGDGGNGGTSSVGTLCTAPGGSGGKAAGAGSSGLGGAGGVAGTGDLSLPGCPGVTGFRSGTTLTIVYMRQGGDAADSVGFGGPLLLGAAGAPAVGYSAGGSGGSDYSGGGTKAGGVGANGLVVITQFCAR